MVRVEVEPDCATLEAERLLIDEVRVRLPEGVSLRQGAGADPARWRLRWGWRAETGCQLVLTDGEPVLELGLAASAEPDRIREAAVRVAWFVTSAPPDPPAPSAPRERAARPEQLPTIPRPEELGEPASPLPSIPEPAAAAQPALASAGAPASASSAMTVGPPPRDSVLQSLSVTLASWRGRSPGLFGALGRLGSHPPQVSMFGSPTTVGANLSLTTNTTRLSGVPAWLMTARAGAILDERLSIGLAYKGLTTTVLTEDGWHGNARTPQGAETFAGDAQLRLHVGGLDVEYIWWPEEMINLSTSATLYGGWLGAEHLDNEGSYGTLLLMSELQGQLLMDLTPWLQTGLGFSWRAPLIQGNDRILGAQELRGFSGTFTVRLKVF